MAGACSLHTPGFREVPFPSGGTLAGGSTPPVTGQFPPQWSGGGEPTAQPGQNPGQNPGQPGGIPQQPQFAPWSGSGQGPQQPGFWNLFANKAQDIQNQGAKYVQARNQLAQQNTNRQLAAEQANAAAIQAQASAYNNQANATNQLTQKIVSGQLVSPQYNQQPPSSPYYQQQAPQGPLMKGGAAPQSGPQTVGQYAQALAGALPNGSLQQQYWHNIAAGTSYTNMPPETPLWITGIVPGPVPLRGPTGAATMASPSYGGGGGGGGGGYGPIMNPQPVYGPPTPNFQPYGAGYGGSTYLETQAPQTGSPGPYQGYVSNGGSYYNAAPGVPAGGWNMPPSNQVPQYDTNGNVIPQNFGPAYQPLDTYDPHTYNPLVGPLTSPSTIGSSSDSSSYQPLYNELYTGSGPDFWNGVSNF